MSGSILWITLPKNLLQLKIPLSIQRKIRFGATIIFMISIIYSAYIFSSTNLSVISIYAFVITIGYFAHILEGKTSYKLYGLHVILFPSIVIFFSNVNLNDVLLNLIIIISLILPFLLLYIHTKIRKIVYIDRNLNLLLIPILVSFFFTLIVLLPSPSTLSGLPHLLILVLYVISFIIFSLQNLNRKWRTTIIDSELKCHSQIELRTFYSEKIVKNKNIDSKDADLMIYYFDKSIDSFIDGDFENAFMSCYKLALEGAFKKYYDIVNYEEKQKKYVTIRDSLAHAKIRKESESTEQLKEIMRTLFDRVIELLKIARFEFLDNLIKNVEI